MMEGSNIGCGPAECAAGTYQVGNGCSPCAPGEWSPAGQSSCSPCPADSYPNSEQTACIVPFVASYLETTEKLKVNTNYLQNSYFTTGTYGDYVAETIDNNNYYGVKYDEVNKRIEHIDTFMTFESDYIRNQETANLLAQFGRCSL